MDVGEHVAHMEGVRRPARPPRLCGRANVGDTTGGGRVGLRESSRCGERRERGRSRMGGSGALDGNGGRSVTAATSTMTALCETSDADGDGWTADMGQLPRGGKSGKRTPTATFTATRAISVPRLTMPRDADADGLPDDCDPCTVGRRQRIRREAKASWKHVNTDVVPGDDGWTFKGTFDPPFVTPVLRLRARTYTARRSRSCRLPAACSFRRSCPPTTGRRTTAARFGVTVTTRRSTVSASRRQKSGSTGDVSFSVKAKDGQFRSPRAICRHGRAVARRNDARPRRAVHCGDLYWPRV
jgi:hypothetical protein